MCLWVQVGVHYRREENILDKIKCIFSLKESYCKMFRGNDQGKIKKRVTKDSLKIAFQSREIFEIYCGS